MSYASERGYRPATRAEKLARGFKPTTRAYTSITDGDVISHRNLQTQGLRDRYGEGINPRGALEERARLRAQELGIRNPRATFDKVIHRSATASVRKGGLGAKFDRSTREYVLPDGTRLTFQELAASEHMRDRETGIWQQWQDIRHQKGPRGKERRYRFLKDYGFMRFINGKWRYVG